MTHIIKNHATHELKMAAQAIRLARQNLDISSAELSYDISERLRAARVQALAQKPRVAHVAEKHWTNTISAWLQRMPTLSKAIVGVPALCFSVIIAQNTIDTYGSQAHSLNSAFEDNSASAFVSPKAPRGESLNIDAILSEKIPLHAYLDKDFNQFIENDKLQAISENKNHAQKSKNIQVSR